MNFVSVFMAVFSMIGAIDLIFGSRLGLGKDFEKGFKLLGIMALTMIGMITLSPAIGVVIKPILDLGYKYLHIEPSLVPAMILANDMGAASLAGEIAKNESMAMFNGLVVSSMMGCTISFTLPVALGMVKEENHKYMLFGFLCGIVTIPIGCFFSGVIGGFGAVNTFLNILPLIIFAVIVAIGLLIVPNACVKIFSVIGKIITILITIGLALGILKALTGVEIIKGLAPIEEGAMICFNASMVMSGAFVFMNILSKIIAKPIKALSGKLGINEASAFGLVSTIATSITTYEKMGEMDNKGIVLNSAFAISAAFLFGSHLAYTMSFNSDYILCVLVGKIIAGISAVVLASLTYKHVKL